MKKKANVSLLQVLAGDAGWQKMSPKQLLIAIWFVGSFSAVPVVVPSAINNDSYIIAIAAVINFYYSCKCLKGSKIEVEE